MAHYKEYKTTDLTEIFDFVGQYPFADMVKNAPDNIPSLTKRPHYSLAGRRANGISYR